MIKSLTINDFRALQNIQKIILGKQVTIIGGQNGTGKSTVLALLGHSSERKETNIFGKPYRTQFQEIIKASPLCDNDNNH